MWDMMFYFAADVNWPRVAAHVLATQPRFAGRHAGSAAGWRAEDRPIREGEPCL